MSHSLIIKNVVAWTNFIKFPNSTHTIYSSPLFLQTWRERMNNDVNRTFQPDPTAHNINHYCRLPVDILEGAGTLFWTHFSIFSKRILLFCQWSFIHLMSNVYLILLLFVKKAFSPRNARIVFASVADEASVECELSKEASSLKPLLWEVCFLN